MTPSIRCTTPCHRDVVQIATFIGRSDPDAAARFLNAFEDTCVTLTRIPDWGSPFQTENPNITGVRVVAIPKFRRHLLFYRRTSDTIEVLRVVHGTRDLPTAFEDVD